MKPAFPQRDGHADHHHLPLGVVPLLRDWGPRAGPPVGEGRAAELSTANRPHRPAPQCSARARAASPGPFLARAWGPRDGFPPVFVMALRPCTTLLVPSGFLGCNPSGRRPSETPLPGSSGAAGGFLLHSQALAAVPPRGHLQHPPSRDQKQRPAARPHGGSASRGHPRITTSPREAEPAPALLPRGADGLLGRLVDLVTLI